VKISYGITVHNEAKELNKLLKVLVSNIDEDDEIVICDDFSNKKTREVIDHWELHSPDNMLIKHYTRKLDGNFAEHKNSVIENSIGDYIFHIDADEYPHETLLTQLKQILEINNVDLLWIPRVNTIDGMQPHHIRKWGWRVSEKNWVNYPDYQARVFRRDSEIRWERPLHEVIRGYKNYSHLPPHEELSLYHPKTIKKQEEQNMFYNKNFSKKMNIRRGL